MKNISKILFVSILAVAFVSCKDWMAAEPEGATKTVDQKLDAGSQTDAAALADLVSVNSQFIQLYAGLGDLGYTRHNDFGYAAICMFMDAQGQDFVGTNTGYDWFSFSNWSNLRDYTTQTTVGLVSNLVWNEYYKIIFTCNAVVGAIDRENPGSESNKFALAQALAVRAFCYLQLAQIYQFTYGDDTKDLPCVPIVGANLSPEEQLNIPRSTVAEVFNLIMEDLNYACDSLDSYARIDKGFVNQAVAFGLRARANLVMKNWAAAAEDADMALALSGATPLSFDEANAPGFASAEAHNVLWANIIVETNDIVQTGIINWPSHMSTFYGDGYTGVGAVRFIADDLYGQISASDVRKGWWLSPNLESPLLDVGNYKSMKEAIAVEGNELVTLKFGTGDGNTTGNAAAAADWILMRAEELILIKAEGLARSGGDGAGVLTSFIQSCRDPKYKIGAHGLSIEDEIWWQRRVELWGEGFAFNDIMRLDKPIDRTGATNWPAAWANQVVPARHGVLLWRIPQAEIEANQGISESDNNPAVSL